MRKHKKQKYINEVNELSKKEIIKNMNSKIDDISSILEKIKKFSGNRNRAFISYLLKENILEDIKEINNILLEINQTLDEIK
jgi:hypothetical protein